MQMSQLLQSDCPSIHDSLSRLIRALTFFKLIPACTFSNLILIETRV
jgi:hypothetical protein